MAEEFDRHMEAVEMALEALAKEVDTSRIIIDQILHEWRDTIVAKDPILGTLLIRVIAERFESIRSSEHMVSVIQENKEDNG